MYPVGIVTSSASTVSSQSSTESIPVTVYMLASAPLGPDSVTPLGKPVAVMSIVGVIGTVIVISKFNKSGRIISITSNGY